MPKYFRLRANSMAAQITIYTFRVFIKVKDNVFHSETHYDIQCFVSSYSPGIVPISWRKYLLTVCKAFNNTTNTYIETRSQSYNFVLQHQRCKSLQHNNQFNACSKGKMYQNNSSQLQRQCCGCKCNDRRIGSST
jgi:hypothetical protein